MNLSENEKTGGLNANGLHTWGMLFLTLGIVGKSLIQNRLLHMGTVTSAELMEAMQSSGTVMMQATLALVFQALETCAVPIFAFLLLEGAARTASLPRYILRVGALAAVSEIPYNLAMSGVLLDGTGRNPVFGSLIGLVMLWFYGRWSDNSFSHVVIRILVALAAMAWCVILSVSQGPALLLILAVLWALREKTTLRNLLGAAAALVCCLGSLFYMAAPMGFLAIHFYNGEKGAENRAVNYLAYPALLLIIWALGVLLF